MILQDLDRSAQTSQGDKLTTAIEVILTEQAPKPTKKAPRARRKLCLDEDVEQQAQSKQGEVRTGGLEDTFIFSPKPKMRQPKRKKEEEGVADGPDQKTKKLAPKVKRTTKAKQPKEDDLESNHATEPAADPEKPEEKPKATKRRTGIAKSTAIIATSISELGEAPIVDGPDLGTTDSAKLLLVADVLLDEVVHSTSKSVKTKTAPKRALKRSIDEVATSVASLHATTPEKAAKRPRRQAAISATEKVAMGYEDDLIPADKLRRAPDVDVKSRKSRKADARGPPATAQLSPSIAQADPMATDPQGGDKETLPSSPPLIVRRGRKPGVKAAKGRACKLDEKLEVVELLPTEHMSLGEAEDHASVEQPPCSPKAPAKRGRKPGVKARKIDTATCSKESEVIELHSTKHVSPAKVEALAHEEETQRLSKIPAKRGRKPGVKARKVDAATNDLEPEVIESQSTKRVSPTKEKDVTPEEQSVHAPKLPAKRGRKPGVKARKVDSTTDHTKPTVATAATAPVLRMESPAALGLGYSINHASKAESTRISHDMEAGSTESLQKSKAIGEQPSKARRALADFDGNIVRKSSTAKGKKQVQSPLESASPPAELHSKSRKTKQEAPVKSKTTCSPDNEPSQGITTTPRKRHVIAAEEDLDWLFEKPETKRLRPAIIRHPTTKTRVKESGQSAKDMDLDDLLASVARFSGKLLTGRRGRVVG
jgi:hypothetical protein